MATTHEDPTRTYSAEDKPWIPLPEAVRSEQDIEALLAELAQ